MPEGQKSGSSWPALSDEEYNDDYATCARTYATFCIAHDALEPEAVTEELGIEPTEARRRGAVDDPGARDPYIFTVGGWFVSSDGKVESRDSRRHIDWLLDQLEPRRSVLRKYRAAGCQMEITCYWLSASGNGGPTLSPKQMARLADLGLEVEFDAHALGGADDNYFARSMRAINTHQAAREARRGEGADDENATGESRTVFPVVRIDLADDPRVPLDAKIDIAEVFTTPEAAWRRLEELRTLYAGKRCKFVWKVASLRDETSEGGAEP